MTVNKQTIFRRANAFWLALALLLIAAAVPRLVLFDFGLPYVDHPDEPSLYLLGQSWRGLVDVQGRYFGYPPGYVAFNIATQVVLETLGLPGMAATVGVLRLFSTLFNVLTVLFAALTARRIAGDFGGIVAGALWAFAPLLVQHGVLALADAPAMLLTMVTVWLAVEALLNEKRPHWVLWSAGFGLLGVVVKYPVAPALLAPGVVWLWLLKNDRRRALRYLAMIAALGVVAFLVVLSRRGVEYADMFINRIQGRDTGLDNLLQPQKALNNLYHAFIPFRPFMPEAALGVVLAGLAAYLAAPRLNRERVRLQGAALVALTVVVMAWMVTIFSVVSVDSRLRDVLPITGPAAVVVGAAAAQVLHLIPKSYRAASQTAVAAALLAGVLWPQVQATRAYVQREDRPDSRVAIRAWAELTLEPAWTLVDRSTHKLFNNIWSGLPGSKWFNWHETSAVMEHTVDEWRQDYAIEYAVIDMAKREQMKTLPQSQAYLDQMLLLRDFAMGDGWRGPDVAVYRLWRMTHETAITFGERIHLRGYDLRDGTTLAPGDTLGLTFYWQADQTPASDFSLFIHLTPLDDREAVAQLDGPPALLARPTVSWNEPTETIVSAWHDLALPAGLPSGEYRVLIGLYDYNTSQRLPITAADGAAGTLPDDTLHLLTITVE